MSDEHDSWLQSAFGLDVGATVQKVADAGEAVVSQAAATVVEAVAPAPAPEPAPAAAPPADVIEAPPGALENLGNMASNLGGSLRDNGAKALGVANDAGNAIAGAETAAWDATKGAYGSATAAYDSVAPNYTQASKDLNQLVDSGEAALKKHDDEALARDDDGSVLGSLERGSMWMNEKMVEGVGGVVKGVGDLASMGGNAIFHPIDAAESLGAGALGIAEHVPLLPGLNTTVKGVHGLVDLARGKTDGQYGGSLSELGENLAMNTQRDPDDPTQKSNTDVDFLAGIGGGTKAWKDKPVEAATRTLTNLAPMLLGDEGAGVKPPPEVPVIPEVPGVPELPAVPEAPTVPADVPTPTKRGLGEPQTQRGLGEPQAPDTLRDPQTQRGLGDPQAPDTLRDPQTQRGLGDPQAPDTLRDPQTQRGLGDPPTERNPGVPEPFEEAPSFRKPAEEPPPEVDDAPPTDVDPPRDPEAKAAKASPAETLEQAKLDVADAQAAVKAAEDVAVQATTETVRYKASMPNPGGGITGDPNWNPTVNEALENAADTAAAEHAEALARLREARRIERDLASRSKGKKGGGGFR